MAKKMAVIAVRVEIKLPYLGPEIEYCQVQRWLVRPGDSIEMDQEIAELVSNGETIIFPSPMDGLLVELCVAEGAKVVVDEPLAVVIERE